MGRGNCMETFLLPLSNASSMSLGFLAFSTRRPLPILPFLVPSWSRNPIAGGVGIRFKSRAAPQPKTRRVLQISQKKPLPKTPKKTPRKTKPKWASGINTKTNISKYKSKQPTRLEDPEKIAVDKEDREGILHRVLELCETYSEDKIHNLIPFLLSEGHSSKAMAKSWAKLDPKECRYGFRLTAGYLLRRSHSKFCTRLIECCCIHNTQSPSPEDVSLAMEFVVRLEFRVSQKQHRKKAAPPRERTERKASRYIDLLLAVLRVDYGGLLRLRQATIYRLLQSASLEEAERLYDGLKEADVTLTTDTMLQFIHRLSEPSSWAKAYSILEGLVQDRRRNLRVPQVWKGFQRLFYKATFIGEEESSKVIRMMLSCGIGPGLTSYNILMSKAARDGDEQSLTQIFRQMFEAGLKPSMVTYGLLHNFYKKQGKELERSQVVRDAIKLNRNLNQVIATDIIDAKIKSSEYYIQILEEYLTFFNPGPLISLGIAHAEPDNPEKGIRKRLEPSHIVVAAMIHAFAVREGDPMAVWAGYQRYCKVIKNQENKYRSSLLDAGCYIPNAYMLSLGRQEDTFRHAVVVMEDMLKFDSPVHPNAYSWSILLYAMAKSGRTRQAEQVLGAMRRKGIKPNVVTWTSLLTGYIKTRSLWQAGDVLRRMIEDKVDPNSKTMDLLLDFMDSDELKKGMIADREEQEVSEGQQEQEAGSTEMTDEEIDILLMRKRTEAI